MTESFKVTCKKCKGSNVVAISNDTIFWNQYDRIISGRKRLDNEWGWQCICGNNSIMTKQEKKHISDPSNPKEYEVSDIVKNLKKEQPTFVMEKV